MTQDEFQRVMVWSGWLRLSHWSLALGTLGLMLSGWRLAQAPPPGGVVDAHEYFAALLVAGLALRLIGLAAGRPQERLAALLPRGAEMRAAAHTLRFYVSLGQSPLPRWYAHNPLWKPVYLAVYLALLIQVATGSLMLQQPVLWGFYLPSVHEFWARALLWFSVAHVAAVALHDLRGKTADVSAMINGYRLYFIDRSQLPGAAEQPLRFVPRDRHGAGRK